MSLLSSGAIKADKWSFEITSGTVEADFLSSEIKAEIHKLIHNREYRSYFTDPSEIYGKMFSFRVYFEKGILVSLALIPASKSPSWDNVEKDALVMEKAENDEWLKNNFAIIAPVDCQWGTLESVIDQRGGFSCVVMRYNKQFQTERRF